MLMQHTNVHNKQCIYIPYTRTHTHTHTACGLINALDLYAFAVVSHEVAMVVGRFLWWVWLNVPLVHVGKKLIRNLKQNLRKAILVAATSHIYSYIYLPWIFN